MKLKKLIIKNFKGLKGTENIIDFSEGDIIFLIGQNNVGKSSFLRAYEFFVNPKSIADIEDFYNYDSSSFIEIEGEFTKEEHDEKNKELQGEGREADPDWIKNWVDSDGIVRIKKQWKTPGGKFDKYTYNPKSEDWELNGFGGFHTHFTHHAPQPIAINAMETAESLEEKVNKMINDDFLKKARQDFPQIYQEATTAVRKLQETIMGKDEIRQFNENINSIFSKVFTNLILEIKPKNEEKLNLVDALKKSHSVHVKKSGIEREETFLQHGHGVIRQALFNFLAFLKNSGTHTKKEYIILFEEPELFLHPKVSYLLRKSLYDLSENSPYQVLCATHSPIMIDISKPHSSLVRVVKYSDEKTKTFQVGDDIFQKHEHKNTIQMVNRMNAHICECFYSDCVFLVEGDTEAIVFRDILARFYPEKEIFVLNTGSKTNIPFFQEILTHFQIEHIVFHDTDDPEKKSSWTMNERIWEGIQKAKGLAKRYVFTKNFEHGHHYTYETDDGKPVAAFNFVQSIKNADEKYQCLVFLKDLFGENKLVHDQKYIETLKLS